MLNSSFPLKHLLTFDKPQSPRVNVSLARFSDITARRASNALSSLSETKSITYRHMLSEYAFSDFELKQLMDFSDEEIISFSDNRARYYARLQLALHSFSDWSNHYQFVKSVLVRKNISIPSIPLNPSFEHIVSACKRLTDELWWRRALRTTQVRLIESEAFRLGHVSRVTKQLYVSNLALSKRLFHKQRNAALLESITAINEEGYEQDLKSLSDVSTSNPKNRRNELMVRLKGLEQYAKAQGLVADFYTLTCPSRFHRWAGGNKALSGGHLNPLFDGSTPREAQAYLNKIWSKVRAELARQNIEIMGMRVAEPHHDGTPHWHLLVFLKKGHRTNVRQTFRRYALEDSSNEKGAKKARFKAIKINSKQVTNNGKVYHQSAVGYICKYISKNLSLDGIEQSLSQDGKNAHDIVNRVEAWASVWGIRQFQQFGGERVTPYRELRRLRSDSDILSDSYFKSLWVSANAADFYDYIRLARSCSKIQIVRSSSNLQLKRFGSRHVKIDRLNIDTGELTDAPFQLDRSFINKFGDFKTPPIIGLSIDNNFLQTRLHTWTTKARKGARASATNLSGLGLVSITVPPTSTVLN